MVIDADFDRARSALADSKLDWSAGRDRFDEPDVAVIAVIPAGMVQPAASD
jgi:hypothetical protein